MLLGLLPLALAGATVHVALPWGVAPYLPRSAEVLARGPQYLAALPDGRVAFYDPVDPGVIVGGARFDVPHATDLAATADGDLLVLDEPSRTLRLYTTGGVLLDDVRLDDLAPMGARLFVDGDTVSLVDVFGNLHRGWIVTDELVAAKGPTLAEPDVRVRRTATGFVVGEHTVATPGAIKASGRLVGEWLVVDVVAEKPLRTRRAAHHLPTGAVVPLSTDDEPYAPRGELALAPDGALLVLHPTAARLEIWRVTP